MTQDPPAAPKRANPRYERRIEVEIVAGTGTFQGFTRDIGLGGMCVRLNAPLAYGARVRLRFHVPSLREVIEADGEVRWVEDQPEGDAFFGIHFLGLRARDVWALNQLFRVS